MYVHVRAGMSAVARRVGLPGGLQLFFRTIDTLLTVTVAPRESVTESVTIERRAQRAVAAVGRNSPIRLQYRLRRQARGSGSAVGSGYDALILYCTN